MPQFRNAIVATGLVAFAAAGLAFPFFFVSSKAKPVIDSSKPLPPQATFRGPYINTGSRDVGPDHGTYPKIGNVNIVTSAQKPSIAEVQQVGEEHPSLIGDEMSLANGYYLGELELKSLAICKTLRP